MELLTPAFGLLFWQVVVFTGLLLLLKKFAWSPILQSLKIREDSIQEALDAAKEAKAEMAELHSENEVLLNKARDERDKIIKAATDAANSLNEEAKANAQGISDRIIAEAKIEIQREKNTALADVRKQVVLLSVEIAEKLIRQSLGEKGAQKSLIEKYLKDKSLN